MLVSSTLVVKPRQVLLTQTHVTLRCPCRVRRVSKHSTAESVLAPGWQNTYSYILFQKVEKPSLTLGANMWFKRLCMCVERGIRGKLQKSVTRTHVYVNILYMYICILRALVGTTGWAHSRLANYAGTVCLKTHNHHQSPILLYTRPISMSVKVMAIVLQLDNIGL